MENTTAGLKKVHDWWMPDYEKHLPDWMEKAQQLRHGRLCYQAHKYDMVKPYLTSFDLAIDVGGHIGLWSFMMAEDFKNAVAFEPIEIHRRCFDLNLAHTENVQLVPNALGAIYGMVAVETRTKDSSGDSGIVGDGHIRMAPLDSFLYKNVSFIKIDCEGYEASVIFGAMKTIRRCKPVIIVEQKGNMSEQYGHKQLAAVKMLQKIGMVLKEEISGDYILTWK